MRKSDDVYAQRPAQAHAAPSARGAQKRRGPASATRGVLFDSGDVLVRPAGDPSLPSRRRWFAGTRFEEIVRSWRPDIDLTRIDSALEHGIKYLDQQHREPLHGLGAERALFESFYGLVLNELDETDPPSSLLAALAGAKVDEEMPVPFDDVRDVLERMHSAGLRMGILSEAWPSLETKYEQLGLRSFFHVFVISAQEGKLKTDRRLFRTAVDRMELPAEQILFVDDWPPFVEIAAGIGLHGAVVDRAGRLPKTDHTLTYLEDLRGVEQLVFGSSIER